MPRRMPRDFQGAEVASVQRTVLKVVVVEPLGRPEFEERGRSARLEYSSYAQISSVPVFIKNFALNEVLNVAPIGEDLGSIPMDPGSLGSEITDECFDDEDKDITSPKPSPSGAIALSEASTVF